MNCFLCGAKLSKNRSPNVCVMCESDHFVERDEADPLEVLRAIGETIATVARARLICTLMAQQYIRWTHDDESVGVDLCFWRGETLETSTVTLTRYTSERPGRGQRLAEWTGHPVDVAAEAVARFIEEVQS